jgi:hypothetical protein
MKKSSAFFSAIVCAGLLSVSAACSKKAPVENAGPTTGHDHRHQHAAPHGGALVELGEEQFHLECVRDPEADTLTVYVLDAHAENFVRITARSIALSVRADGAKRTLELNAIANAATGETVGDTSAFAATADWIGKTDTFEAVIPSIEIRGTTFEAVTFPFPQGSAEAHAH